MPKILICDDEPGLRAVIKRYAEFAGHEVTEAADGLEAVQVCKSATFDIIIMDIMMPEMDGFSAVEEIRKTSEVPVIMLSARGEEYDKILGFKLGVDDYVVKPFSSKEIMLRVAAILKRTNGLQAAKSAEPPHEIFQKDGFLADMTAHKVQIDGETAELSPKLYDLLFFLIRNKNIAVSREKLLTEVWGYDFYGDDRTLDTHVKLLRKALGRHANLVKTLRLPVGRQAAWATDSRVDMNKIRLKWKIFALLLGFCGLLLIILWLFQTIFLTDMYKFIRTQELQQTIELVANEIENPNLQDILHNIEVESGILVELTPNFMPPPQRRPPPPNSGQSPPARQSRSFQPFRPQQEPPIPETITEVREFQLSNGQAISLTFYALISPVDATVATLRYQLYLISGIMLVLSVAIAIFIAKWVSKPIERISQNAMVLAKGDYTAQFDGRGFYEIVRLSQTLNKVAEDLGKVEGLRRELLANVSHDLRTPLALIYSYAEMMHDFPQEITAEQTQTIMDETQRLTTLVNDVLDISKLETAMDSLNITNFNLTKNIEETASRVEELLKSEGFRIIFSKGELGEIYVHGDETKINRAFYNLLVNAVNYSGESKTIQVEQIEIDNRIRIQIKDSGEGISPAELPLIWSKYKSGKNGKFDKIGKFGKKRSGLTGMGLGLHIVKTIIERHGWRCGVQSVVGAGSVFWFEVSGDI